MCYVAYREEGVMRTEIRQVLCLLAAICTAALVWFDYPKTKSTSADLGLLLGTFNSSSRSDIAVGGSVIAFGLLSSYGKSLR